MPGDDLGRFAHRRQVIYAVPVHQFGDELHQPLVPGQAFFQPEFVDAIIEQLFRLQEFSLLSLAGKSAGMHLCHELDRIM